ncbi:glycosyltransferase family 4 protein [Paludibacter sp. 221]|uniref:glycosyltransferase family 4 protein n=1 Tax=Paludibacter sp. 221 TaxID=2302939 RepID=UPI0013D5115F|nr:glycosyltransferase family 4 protein [Paludibacter sp. 221]NDV47547.1 glycosyltransferase family 4 protein [Paludibacter sp. 221]
MKVLFLSAWYPNRYDAMAGLFVQKHAEAVNLYCDVKVLYIHLDENIKEIEIKNQYHNKLNEIIVYYPVKKRSFFHKALKALAFFKAYKKGFEYLNETGFSPDILHANVLTRTGFIAYLYKKRNKIPYVITEHWSRYLPENFSYNGCVHRKITELVVKNASAVMPVSGLLEKEMKKNGLHNPCYKVVSNVVDDFFFEKPQKKENRTIKRIFHISCFDDKAKNISGILKAAKMLTERRTDFELIIIGTGADYNQILKYSNTLDFPLGSVMFLGEKTSEEVAWWFQNSDFFVLFSNYETAGVVIAESLASGVPVLSTPTGIVPDVINDDNGIVVEFKNEKMLCDAMNYMLDNHSKYDVEKIRGSAYDDYSYESVGKRIYAIYSKTLNV